MASVYDNYTSYGTKTIQLKVKTTWGETLTTCAVSGTEVHFYAAGEWGMINCRKTSGISLWTSTTVVPVYYDVGTTGSDWTSNAYIQDDLTVDDNSWTYTGAYTLHSSASMTGSGSISGTFHFVYGTSQATPELSCTVYFKSQNVSFKTYGTDRSDYSRQPVITGKCNYPVTFSGSDTSVTLRVKRYYKTDKWTSSNGASANWGETISGAYFNGKSITLTGKLYCYKSSLETFLDTLPIPAAPSQESTDDVQLIDDSVTPAKTETLQIYRKKTYTFYNWNTKADGSGKAYGTGGSSLSTSGFKEDTTLYAQWKDSTVTNTSLPSDWTSSRRVKESDTPYKTAKLTCYYNGATNNVYDRHTCYQYTYRGVKLDGWKGSDGSVVSPGSPAGGASSYTAIWVLDPDSTANHVWEDNTYTPVVPSARNGWEYLGVDTSATAKVPDYPHPATVTITSDTNVYAIWKAKGAVRLYDENGVPHIYQIYICDGKNNWKLYMPKIYDGSSWNKNYV